MVYRAIGLMSGSSLDGLDIAFVEFEEQGGKWTWTIPVAECRPFSEEWKSRLAEATTLSAREYLLLHTAFGHYLGQEVNAFINKNGLQYKVAVIASHGHTSFHMPAAGMTAQLGDGAAIAAETGLPVVTDLRALDVALGGQGAPVVPIGERLLLGGYRFFLNIGGIANISANAEPFVAYDICPANRVLNLLASDAGFEMDEGGKLASGGQVNKEVLALLNDQSYYALTGPKSLANDFGTDVLYPLLKRSGLTLADQLCTYTEHIAEQTGKALQKLNDASAPDSRLLVTGGGAFNTYLLERIRHYAQPQGVTVEVPDAQLINYKEALVMALMGVLRWRQENNVFASVTGARRSSVGGALWMGEEG